MELTSESLAITEPTVLVPASVARRLLPLIKRGQRDAVFNGGVIRPDVVAVIEAFETVTSVSTSEYLRTLEVDTSERSPSSEALLTSRQAAEVIGVTDRQVRSLAQEGTLKGRMVGARWRFERKEVDEYAEGRCTDGKPA